MKRVLVLAALLLVVAAWPGAANAQTTTIEIRDGEVLAVDGNVVTVRGPQGVKQFVVPEDFQFNIDGKMLTVRDLKPGMKYAAVVTTKETPVEVTTTEVREAEVVYATTGTVVVRNLQTQELRKFTSNELRSLNLVIYKDGKQIDPVKLRKGDRVSATIVTKYPPEVLTEQDLKVFVAAPPPPPRWFRWCRLLQRPGRSQQPKGPSVLCSLEGWGYQLDQHAAEHYFVGGLARMRGKRLSRLHRRSSARWGCLCRLDEFRRRHGLRR